ncbi:MAG: hypothetical protein HC798_02215, partial [Polaribacter sp.]|nr:hypothetical protein [Polaribacter sp.]
LRKIYSVKSYKNSIRKLFDVWFWLAILVILQPQMLFFFILIYLAVSIFLALNWQTIFSSIFGFLSVLLIDFCCFLYQNEANKYLEKFKFDFQFYNISSKINWIIFYAFFTILLIASVYKSLQVLPFNTSFRKRWFLLHLHLVVAVFTSFLIEDFGLILFIFQHQSLLQMP